MSALRVCSVRLIVKRQHTACVLSTSHVSVSPSGTIAHIRQFVSQKHLNLWMKSTDIFFLQRACDVWCAYRACSPAHRIFAVRIVFTKLFPGFAAFHLSFLRRRRFSFLRFRKEFLSVEQKLCTVPAQEIGLKIGEHANAAKTTAKIRRFGFNKCIKRPIRLLTPNSYCLASKKRGKVCVWLAAHFSLRYTHFIHAHDTLVLVQYTQICVWMLYRMPNDTTKHANNGNSSTAANIFGIPSIVIFITSFLPLHTSSVRQTFRLSMISISNESIHEFSLLSTRHTTQFSDSSALVVVSRERALTQQQQ